MKKSSIKINKFSTQRVCIFAVSLILVSVFFYLYSYQLSVSRAATIESLEDKISNLKSEISESEFKVVEARRSVNKETAIEAGFTEIKEVVFVKRTQVTALNAQTN